MLVLLIANKNQFVNVHHLQKKRIIREKDIILPPEEKIEQYPVRSPTEQLMFVAHHFILSSTDVIGKRGDCLGDSMSLSVKWTKSRRREKKNESACKRGCDVVLFNFIDD